MTIRIECDFRHGLAEPTITRDRDGPVFTLAHGQERIRVALSEASLRALWLEVCHRSPIQSHSGSSVRSQLGSPDLSHLVAIDRYVYDVGVPWP